ncbi:MAG: hypothetical protein HQM09_08130 [Candidatus Riflebacteria bacterium]|nr:hypothetical protein [Candidatus Riflebacteria bacterium]
MDLYIRLSEAFLESPGTVLSIHQLSRRLDIPYGTAYNRVHQLGEMGILRIVPQGKAKLCALNPENPQTSAILGLGAARKTSEALAAETHVAWLVSKLKAFLENRLSDHLHAALLLNAQAFLNQPSSVDRVPESDPAPAPSLDLFLILDESSFEDHDLEPTFHAFAPSSLQPRITYMSVTPSSLLEMLRERENEAGLSAYHMLHEGIILFGFERFFRLVIQAFAPPRL